MRERVADHVSETSVPVANGEPGAGFPKPAPQRRRRFWLLQPAPRNAIAWMIAAGLAASYVLYGWRLDGWVSCDFGGPWLLGRMFDRGEARNLYLREPQRAALATGYQGKELLTVDQEILGKSNYEWEGPLYPPTAGLLMWPVSILDARACHAVLSVLFAQLIFVSAWMMSRLCDGRLRTGEIALFLFVFPNSCQTLILGQNAALTLAMVTAGLLLWRLGWPLAGGLVWGLLAYKPVFAVALVWAPLLLGSRRMFVGMILGGLTFCLATVPFCGLDAWWRWFIVGRNNAELYSRDQNWIWLSRDLLGLPRRQMWDAEHLLAHVRYLIGLQEKNDEILQAVQLGPVQTAIGWGLMGAVLLVTVLIALRRGKPLSRAGIGHSFRSTSDSARQTPELFTASFLLLGGLLTCYHFMYYDVLVFALPLTLLAAEWRWLGWPGRAWVVLLVGGMVACQLDMELVAHSAMRLPFETFLLLLAWSGAGILASNPDCKRSADSGIHNEKQPMPSYSGNDGNQK